MPEIKAGVFISHIVQESRVALVLQEYLKKAFGEEFPVFVSSDQTSIGGGRKWFEHILTNLKRARVILVLVSQESAKREWINFEAGFGDGDSATVIPIAIKEFSFAKLGFPLQGYNGRLIGDVEGVLYGIARETGIVSQPVDTLQYRADMLAAEASLIYKSVIVALCRSADGQSLTFSIQNNGNTDLDLLMFEAWVPSDMLRPDAPRTQLINVLYYNMTTIDQETYLHGIYTTATTTGAHGIESLRAVITRSMGEIKLRYPVFVLRSPMAARELSKGLYYQLHARNHDTVREKITLAEERDFS